MQKFKPLPRVPPQTATLNRNQRGEGKRTAHRKSCAAAMAAPFLSTPTRIGKPRRRDEEQPLTGQRDVSPGRKWCRRWGHLTATRSPEGGRARRQGGQGGTAVRPPPLLTVNGGGWRKRKERKRGKGGGAHGHGGARRRLRSAGGRRCRCSRRCGRGERAARVEEQMTEGFLGSSLAHSF